MPGNRLTANLRRTAVALVAGLMCAASPAHAANSVDQARQYFEAGDQKAAVIELKNALQQDPGNATARLLLGKLYLKGKDGPAAEKELLRAAELGADPGEWRLNLVEALILQGKYSDALDRLDAAPDLPAADQARALALRGDANLGLKQFHPAGLAYDQAIKLDPNNEKAALGKVMLALANNDLEAGTKAADGLLGRFPENAEALLIRAELHRNKGEMKEAAERFAQAMQQAPNDIRPVLGHATAMIALRDLAAAKADLDRADQIQKDVVMSHYLRGLVFFQEQEWDKAKEHLTKVLSAMPGHLQSQLLLGIIAFSGGDLQIAEEYLSRVVSAMPGNPQAVKILAATRIKLREPARAIEVLEPLASQQPDAQTMALLGSAYMLKGDQEKGQEWLSRAVEASPDIAALRTQLALTLLAGGETDKAITELQSAVDMGQGILQADVLLVLAQLKEKRFDEAIESSQALEQRMADSPIPYNLTGLAYLAQGEKDKAAERFAKALAVDPKFVTAELNLARIDVADDHPEAAQKRYERVLGQQPTHLGALLGLAALAERRGDEPAMVGWLDKAQEGNQAAVQPGLLLARYYVSKKEGLKAVSIASTLAGRFPGNVQVLEMLARAQTLAGETASAVRTFEQLAQLQPEDPQSHLLLGGAKWKAGDLHGAREAFQRGIGLKPDFVNARVALASVELQDGRADEALEVAKGLKRDFPDSPVGFQIEGGIYQSQKRPAEAVKALEAAYGKEKSGPLARQLAQAYAEDNRRPQAIAVLEAWLAEHPDDVGALGMAAMYYQVEGRDADAIKAYEALATGERKDVIVLNNLAWLYHKTGDARALDTARKAYDLDATRPEVADTYGWILLQSGKAEEGLSILQQAYVSQPTQTEIGYHVAVGLSEVGRKDEAIKVARRLLRENPGFEQAGQAKALIEELEKK